MADVDNVTSGDVLEYEEDVDDDLALPAAEAEQITDADRPAGNDDQQQGDATNGAEEDDRQSSPLDDNSARPQQQQPHRRRKQQQQPIDDGKDDDAVKREPKHELDELDAEPDPAHVEQMSRSIDRVIVDRVLGAQQEEDGRSSVSGTESGEQSDDSSSAESGEEREDESEGEASSGTGTQQSGEAAGSKRRRRVRTCADSRDVRWFFKDARFFLIKSGNAENVSLSKAKGVWATTAFNQRLLTQRFRDTRNVILVFSVERSGSFQGFARLGSVAEQDHSPVNWVLPPGMDATRLGGIFRLQWLCRQPLPFDKTMHLINPLNENRPVKIGRDGTEIQHTVGKALCELFSLDDAIDHGRLIKKAQLQHAHGEAGYKRLPRAYAPGAPAAADTRRRGPPPPRAPPAGRPRSTVLASGRIGKPPPPLIPRHVRYYDYPPPLLQQGAPAYAMGQPHYHLPPPYAYPAAGDWYASPSLAVAHYAPHYGAPPPPVASSSRRRPYERERHRDRDEPRLKRHRSHVVVPEPSSSRPRHASPPRAYSKQHRHESPRPRSRERRSSHSRHRQHREHRTERHSSGRRPR